MSEAPKKKVAEDLGIQTDKQLRKALGKFDLLYLSLGGIIGSGWLFGPLFTAAYAGGAAILSWIIAGILVIFIGLAYAEIASAIPKTGGIVRYPHYTHGGLVSYIMAWMYLLSAASVPAIEAAAVVQYMSYFVPSLYNTSTGQLTTEGIALAYILLILFFLLNYFGVNLLGKVTHAAGWWKLLIPTITVIILLAVFNPANLTAGGGFFPNPSLTSSGTTGFAAVLGAIPATGVIFSYLGFRQAVEFGGEGKNPQKDIPFAVIGSLLIALVLYTLLQLTFIGAVNWKAANVTVGNWTGLASSVYSQGPFLNEIKYAPVAGLLASLFTVWAIILAIDAVISPSGTGWIYLGTSARTYYGFGANGALPQAFLRLNRFKVPTVSMIAALITGMIFLLPFPSWQSLVGFISSATVFTYIVGGIALETLRKHAPELKRPFKLTGARVIAPIATVAAILIVYWSTFTVLYYIVTGLFIGLAIFFAYYARKELKLSPGVSAGLAVLSLVLPLAGAYLYNEYPPVEGFAIYLGSLLVTTAIDLAVLWAKTPADYRVEIKASAWVWVLVFGMLILSFLGSLGPLSPPPLPFPYDTIAAAILGIVVHYLAVKLGFRTEAVEEIIEETQDMAV